MRWKEKCGEHTKQQTAKEAKLRSSREGQRVWRPWEKKELADAGVSWRWWGKGIGLGRQRVSTEINRDQQETCLIYIENISVWVIWVRHFCLFKMAIMVVPTSQSTIQWWHHCLGSHERPTSFLEPAFLDLGTDLPTPSVAYYLPHMHGTDSGGTEMR